MRAVDHTSAATGGGRYARLLCLAVMLTVGFSSAFAQRAGVSMQEGPHYVGDAVLVRVTAEDFDEAPQPTCEPQEVGAGLSVTLANVAPLTSSFVQIINGRRTEHKTVRFNFDFQVTASTPGVYRIGGFQLSQGTKSTQASGISIQFNEVETASDMRILLELPPGPVYPGQRAPVTLEWWYAGELEAVASMAIRAGLFDQFRFEDEPIQRGDTAIPIIAGMGTLQLKARVDKRKLDGREYLVVTAQRTLIVDKPGRYELAPVSVNVEKAVRWTRDVFGRRRPAETARVRAVGQPQTLVVESLPLDKAPPGFAGAVGQGFSIDVAADRTVVHVGDPIRLTLTLRGDGNIESAGLAPLAYAGGLDPKRFRSPGSDATGVMAEDGRSKRFDVTVRVLDASVDQIPPISYAWFDPVLKQYQTTQSSPIALRVLAGQVIGAQDVVDANPPTDEEPAPVEVPRAPVAVDDLTGADLTIETDIGRLAIADADRFGGVGALVAVYAVSGLVVLLAWWRRRAADVDPAVIARRRLLRAQLGQIQQAVRQPRQAAAREIGAACRCLVPYAGTAARPEIDALIGECDALAFAPVGEADQRIDESLHRRAVDLAQRIARERS